MSTFEILHDDALLFLGRSRNLVAAAWCEAPGVEQVRALGRAMALVHRAYPADFAVLSLVVRGTPNFADDSRKLLSEIVGDPKNQGHGGAHVILVEGLAGVAVRAFLSTVFLLARGPSPNKVFAEVRAAASWIAPRLASGQERWTVDEVATVGERTLQGARSPTSRPPV